MSRVRFTSLTFAFWKGIDAMCLAIPGKIVELADGQSEVGIVEVAGVRRKVQLGLLSEDMPVKGDWVLIHVGFAMSKISEFDAAEQMRILSMLGEIDQAMEEVRGYGADGNSGGNNGGQAPRSRPN
jgi:hydrogenase expression/formation protein HypC